MKGIPVVFIIMLFFSCKKSPFLNSGDTGQFQSAVNVQTNDEVRFSSEIDAAFNDVNTVLNGQTPCNAQVALDSLDSLHFYSIVYNGNACDTSRSRTGTININYKPGTSWTTAGDTVTVVFINYLVTRISDSKTFELNGGFYYVDISGGNLSGLTTEGATPIVHTMTGVNLGITYDDGSTAVWQVARQRTYTYNNGLTITTRGLDSAGGIANVAEWGGNRYGNSVVTAVISPLVINQACHWQLDSGQVQLSNPQGVTTVTYGLNAAGTPATGCPARDSTYYLGLSWSGTGETPYSALLHYSY